MSLLLADGSTLYCVGTKQATTPLYADIHVQRQQSSRKKRNDGYKESRSNYLLNHLFGRHNHPHPPLSLHHGIPVWETHYTLFVSVYPRVCILGGVERPLVGQSVGKKSTAHGVGLHYRCLQHISLRRQMAVAKKHKDKVRPLTLLISSTPV